MKLHRASCLLVALGYVSVADSSRQAKVSISQQRGGLKVTNWAWLQEDHRRCFLSVTRTSGDYPQGPDNSRGLKTKVFLDQKVPGPSGYSNMRAMVPTAWAADSESLKPHDNTSNYVSPKEGESPYLGPVGNLLEV